MERRRPLWKKRGGEVAKNLVPRETNHLETFFCDGARGNRKGRRVGSSCSRNIFFNIFTGNHGLARARAAVVKQVDGAIARDSVHSGVDVLDLCTSNSSGFYIQIKRAGKFRDGASAVSRKSSATRSTKCTLKKKKTKKEDWRNSKWSGLNGFRELLLIKIYLLQVFSRKKKKNQVMRTIETGNIFFDREVRDIFGVLFKKRIASCCFSFFILTNTYILLHTNARY